MKKLALGLLLTAACLSAFAEDAKTPFQKVLDVLADRHVMNDSLDTTLRKLGGLCKKSDKPDREQYKDGNVVCVESVGIDSLHISDPLNIVFQGKEKGAYAKSLLFKNFGAHPEHVMKELKWRPKQDKRDQGQVYAEFEEDKEAKGEKFYFGVGTETDTGDGQGD